MHIYEINIDSELKRFWELEEVPNSTDTVFSPEEQFVETHFRENYSINSDGRFVVKLPFLKSKSELGNSKPAALSRLYAMEPSTASRLMGNLPKHRVTLERPFFNCGVDYAGPISIKFNKGRGAKSTKGYIALFICLATKALHIEAVSDLTADAFLAALRRFSARRGAPSHIYSDNATNFVGANRKAQRKYNDSSPHFGGIKSTKYHCKRVIGETLLTFEELTTLLAQIEAILNSRPLCSVNNTDIDCINIPTPSHFLTGDVILSPPELPLTSPANIRNRWDLLQKMCKDFCKSWTKAYLSSLQNRKKWKVTQPNMKTGDIVLLLDDGHIPGSWPLGQVVELHHGIDGLVRVATVKTKNSVFKRNIHKLAPLPIYQD
ncbi:uncharacterized protein LOC118198073 [Stegodyphus dumicola]|uniref:uncharacterized protein LOC118198073 n=1 Tax=Stegodyphus dumicola TaxID=202533 RepID=UPI0015AF002D|nr:uncharacterized protein LOC118198073 [Stegodyphus dumicola]